MHSVFHFFLYSSLTFLSFEAICFAKINFYATNNSDVPVAVKVGTDRFMWSDWVVIDSGVQKKWFYSPHPADWYSKGNWSFYADLNIKDPSIDDESGATQVVHYVNKGESVNMIVTYNSGDINPSISISSLSESVEEFTPEAQPKKKMSK